MIEKNIIVITTQPDSLGSLVAVIKTILQQNPMVVEPQTAMLVARQHNCDLAIIDIHASRDALPLIRNFKESFPKVPVITLVPYGDISTVEKVMAHDADDYISQPISLERLKTTLRNALRMRALLLQAHPSSVAQMHYEAMRLTNPAAMMLDARGNLKTLREIEEAVIDYAIKSCNGCITQAARALGIGRSTLYRKMQEQEEKAAANQMPRENQTTRPIMVASSRRDS